MVFCVRFLVWKEIYIFSLPPLSSVFFQWNKRTIVLTIFDEEESAKVLFMAPTYYTARRICTKSVLPTAQINTLRLSNKLKLSSNAVKGWKIAFSIEMIIFLYILDGISRPRSTFFYGRSWTKARQFLSLVLWNKFYFCFF